MQWSPAIRVLGIHIAAKLNEESEETKKKEQEKEIN